MLGIGDWLDKLGMGKYRINFDQQQITAALLQELTDQDLKEIGVAALGHRKILLKAIAEIKASASYESVVPASNEGVPPPQARAVPEGERRQLTVMFCDLVDSTPLAAQLNRIGNFIFPIPEVPVT